MHFNIAMMELVSRLVFVEWHVNSNYSEDIRKNNNRKFGAVMKLNNIYRSVIFTLIILISCFQNTSAQTDLLISPSPIYFGQIPVGSSSVRDITIFNTTINSVTINSISISGVSANEFNIIDNPGSITLNAIGKVELKVQFVPVDNKKAEAEIIVSSSSGTYTEVLDGFGITPRNGIQPFERILGTAESEGAADIKATNDGGYILIGSITPPKEDFPFIYLMKLDVHGKMLWTNTFGDDDGFDSGVDIIQVSDGGYIALANTENWGAGGSDIMLLKFDSAGEKLWHKTFGTNEDESGSEIIQTLDGGYLILGTTFPAGGIGKSTILIKTNADGDKQWEKLFEGTNANEGADIIQLSDGAFVFVGFVAIGEDFQLSVVKTNLSGEVSWEKQFGGSNWEKASSIEQTSDGGFIVSGYTASEGSGARDGYLVKLNSNGDINWTKTFGDTHSDSFGDVIQLEDGGYIAVGSSVTIFTDEQQFTDIFIVRTDASGNEVWRRLYGKDKSEGAGRIEKADDGGFVILGGTGSYSKANDIYLLKIDPNGLISSVKSEYNNLSKVPSDFNLYQNYPNPFNPTTNIEYTIPASEFRSRNSETVTLRIYDILGREVAILVDTKQKPGMYKVKWDASNYASGIYFYELITTKYQQTKKLMLLK